MATRLLAEKGEAQGALEPHPLMAHLTPQRMLSNNHLSRGLEVFSQVLPQGMCVPIEEEEEEKGGDGLSGPGREWEVQNSTLWATRRTGSSSRERWGATEGYKKGRVTIRRDPFSGMFGLGEGWEELLWVSQEE